MFHLEGTIFRKRVSISTGGGDAFQYRRGLATSTGGGGTVSVYRRGLLQL